MQRFTALVIALARRTWVITAATVVICSAFAARGATALIDAQVLTPGPSAGARSIAHVPQRPPVRPKDGLSVERNPFCSSCSPADASGGVGMGAAGVGVGAIGTPAVLIATDMGADWRATVRVVGSDVQGSWGIGDAIPGLGQVDRIGPMWIELVDGAGRRGRLSLLEAAGGDHGAPQPDRPPAVASRWAGRLEKLGEQDYIVDRALVRELVTAGSRPGGLRMVPIFDNGEIKGVRLGVVPRDSIPFALDLRTGDTLTAIEGAPLKSLDQLLDLYARLDQLGAVELSGTRAGKPLVRTLRLR
jgi:hypothetical protein